MLAPYSFKPEEYMYLTCFIFLYEVMSVNSGARGVGMGEGGGGRRGGGGGWVNISDLNPFPPLPFDLRLETGFKRKSGLRRTDSFR